MSIAHSTRSHYFPASSWPRLLRLGPSVVLVDVAVSFYPQPDHASSLMQLQAAEVEGAGEASEEKGEIVGLNTTWRRHRAGLQHMDACRHRAGWELAQHHVPSSFNASLRTGWSISKKALLPPAEHRANALGSTPNFNVREWVR